MLEIISCYGGILLIETLYSPMLNLWSVIISSIICLVVLLWALHSTMIYICILLQTQFSIANDSIHNGIPINSVSLQIAAVR